MGCGLMDDVNATQVKDIVRSIRLSASVIAAAIIGTQKSGPGEIGMGVARCWRMAEVLDAQGLASRGMGKAAGRGRPTASRGSE